MSEIGDQYFAVQKYTYISAVALTLYDYLLMFDDEVEYVWKGPQSWIFYLYLLYRCLLTGYQFWHIYFVILDPDGSTFSYTVDTSLQVIVITIFLVFSDSFVTLRAYAMSFKNKMVAVYLATLALARCVLAISGFLIFGGRWLQNVTVAIGTTFELSSFVVVIWYTYRNRNSFRLSGLVHTIVSQATVYVIFIVIVQVFTQVALNLMEAEEFEAVSFGIYGLVNPPLIIRFVISLKKSADPTGREKWQLEHFTTIDFYRTHPEDTQDAITRDGVELVPVGASRGYV